MLNKENISIVWFKRDLRLEDNEAVFNALNSGNKVLFIYVFEPLLLNDIHYSKRHFDFIKQSLLDLNSELKKHKTQILIVQSSVENALEKIQEKYNIQNLYSHQETGLISTFHRDKKLKKFCETKHINWIENINNGVFRGRKNRVNWVKDWERYMKSPLFSFRAKPNQFITIKELQSIELNFTIPNLQTERSKFFQYGGRSTGIIYKNSFFKERYLNYARHISKPTKARISCSRLSPYIAWGNFSVRELFQRAKKIRPESKNKRSIDGFTSRLRWQAHFIQKFEMECSMQTVSLNRGYTKLNKKINLSYQKVWQEGQTGFPIIDACMRCLVTTGYLNFRMRAMVVSFFTYNLWQPWQNASKFLSQQFLDFEPGIHFPQIQMQAGEIGVNTIRIYNPIKNSLEHDPESEFIKKWVPELAHLPLQFVHEPYLMSPIDQSFERLNLGKDYPYPIIDLKKTRKKTVAK